MSNLQAAVNDVNDEEALGASCPMNRRSDSEPAIFPHEELCFAKRRRVQSAYVRSVNGELEFHIYYGNKEVIFDEPELFPFAETLVREAQFAAGATTSWGSGYSWQQMSKVLGALVLDGVLARTAEADSEAKGKDGVVSSLLPPAVRSEPVSWLQCEQLTRELGGHEVELGYLELLVPVYRIAHANLDADGRQVGEANVYPPALRLDVATEWRTCQYPGSRFQDQCPMNVSALKAMTKYWKPLMRVIHRLRGEYLERFPEARAGLNLGDVERLCTLILAFPTYFLHRTRNRLENGELHPLLSAMFRVTDGLRLSLQAMMTTPTDEPPLSPTEYRTCDEIYSYTERTLGFISAYGVCSGPRHLIEEFLAVVITGKCVPGSEVLTLDPEIEDFLGCLKPAFDYGLRALEAYAVSSSLWGLIAQTYSELASALERVPEPERASVAEFAELVERRVEHLREQTLLATSEQRLVYERIYAHMYQCAERGLGTAEPSELKAGLQPISQISDGAARQKLELLLATRFGAQPAEKSEWLSSLAATLMDYFKREQAIVRFGGEVQRSVNALLERAQPKQALSGADLAIHNRFLPTVPPFPYVEDDLLAALRIRVSVTESQLLVGEALHS
jgi:hypothetical protein